MGPVEVDAGSKSWLFFTIIHSFVVQKVVCQISQKEVLKFLKNAAGILGRRGAYFEQKRLYKIIISSRD